MRTRFSRHDRLWIGGSAYQPVDQNDTIVQLLRLDGSGAVERLTYEQIDEFRASADLRYERNYFANGETAPAPRPDGTRLAALRPKQRNRVLFMHNVCTVMLEMYVAGELALTYSYRRA